MVSATKMPSTPSGPRMPVNRKQIDEEMDLLKLYALFEQRLTDSQGVGMVDVQHCDRGPSNCRLTAKPSAVPNKVLGPNVVARMKKPDELIAGWIASCDVRAFEVVAVKTGEGQIVGSRLSAV